MLRPEPEQDGVAIRSLSTEPAVQREQRHFGPADLAVLERLLSSADDVLPLREVSARAGDGRARMVSLRHDLDHDVENAVRLAHREAERGWRGTYFVLHSDWYWGRRGPARPSSYVLRALDRIAALGHEIGVHNNALAEGLRTGREPAEILGEVLAALRGHGFEIVGTSGHGDPLARRLGFTNQELFVECPDPAGRDPHRTLTWFDPAAVRQRNLTLRPVPMASLGLDYEAYSIGNELYLSDAEGRWNAEPSRIADLFARRTTHLQVLTHPVHWALDGEPITPVPTRAPAVIAGGGAAIHRPASAPVDPVARPASLKSPRPPVGEDGAPLTISLRRGDTPAPSCTQLPDFLYDYFMTPTSPGRPFGRYQDGCSILELTAPFDAMLAEPRFARWRQEIRRSERAGYVFSEIDPEPWAEDILEVNRSMPERQGRPIDASYLDRPVPRRPAPAGCEHHRERWFAVQKDGHVVAYAWVYQAGEMCLLNRLLGHADHDKSGQMYRLIAGVIETLEPAGLRYVMYERHTSGTAGLRAFKERLGFRPRWVDWQRADEAVSSTRPAFIRYRERQARPAGPARRLARRIRRAFGAQPPR